MDANEKKMMEAETEALRNMFIKLNEVCYDRCVRGNYESDTLSKGESVCTDECTAKV